MTDHEVRYLYDSQSGSMTLHQVDNLLHHLGLKIIDFGIDQKMGGSIRYVCVDKKRAADDGQKRAAFTRDEFVKALGEYVSEGVKPFVADRIFGEEKAGES